METGRLYKEIFQEFVGLSRREIRRLDDSMRGFRHQPLSMAAVIVYLKKRQLRLDPFPDTVTEYNAPLALLYLLQHYQHQADFENLYAFADENFRSFYEAACLQDKSLMFTYFMLVVRHMEVNQ